jgi:hypothetical protein
MHYGDDHSVKQHGGHLDDNIPQEKKNTPPVVPPERYYSPLDLGAVSAKKKKKSTEEEEVDRASDTRSPVMRHQDRDSNDHGTGGGATSPIAREYGRHSPDSYALHAHTPSSRKKSHKKKKSNSSNASPSPSKTFSI